jgi:hypothetical protein
LSVFTALLALEIFVVAPLASLGVLGTRLIDVVFSLLVICGALALHPGQVLRVLVVIFVGIAIGLRWMAAWSPRCSTISRNREGLESSSTRASVGWRHEKRGKGRGRNPQVETA